MHSCFYILIPFIVSVYLKNNVYTITSLLYFFILSKFIGTCTFTFFVFYTFYVVFYFINIWPYFIFLALF